MIRSVWASSWSSLSSMRFVSISERPSRSEPRHASRATGCRRPYSAGARRRSTIAAPLCAIALAACSSGRSTASSPTSDPKAFGAGLSTYIGRIQADVEATQQATEGSDFSAIKTALITEADDLRDYRLALQTSSAPAVARSVEGSALLEALKRFEDTLRATGSCSAIEFCTSEIQAMTAAQTSFGRAQQDFNTALVASPH